MEWKDQYKHPLWQKKRLEVLEYNGFVCQSCESVDKTIHVHHRRYVKGRKIWEYGVLEFDVLCEGCHSEVHAHKDILMDLISRVPAYEIASFVALVGGFISSEVDIGELEGSLKCLDSQMFESGFFAFVCRDYKTNDIAELKRMSPDEMHGLAENIRKKRNG